MKNENLRAVTAHTTIWIRMYRGIRIDRKNIFVKHYARPSAPPPPPSSPLPWHFSHKRHAHSLTLCQRWKSLNLFFSCFFALSFSRCSVFGVVESLSRSVARTTFFSIVNVSFIASCTWLIAFCVYGGVLRWRMVVILVGRYNSRAKRFSLSLSMCVSIYCSLAFRIAINSLLHFELLTTSIPSFQKAFTATANVATTPASYSHHYRRCCRY